MIEIIWSKIQAHATIQNLQLQLQQDIHEDNESINDKKQIWINRIKLID